MNFRRECLTGRETLAAGTTLLQRATKEDFYTGLFEAADLQWWWREEGALEQKQQFWYDAEGPVAALLLYEGNKEWDCYLFALPSLKRQIDQEVVPEALAIMSKLSGSLRITVQENDFSLSTALDSHGWRPSGEAMVQAYLAVDLSRDDPLPPGFRFEVRAMAPERPHPMTNKNRNPRNVEGRLAESSLYRADLDYAVVHSSGEVAAYALFWMDPVTKVGLIEPMRTEDAFQHQGIGRALISEGVRRLRDEGAAIIKVSYKERNIAARRLYHGCEFRDLFRKVVYGKTVGEPGIVANVVASSRHVR